MGIEVELQKLVLASPKSVWALLASPGAWSTWWKEVEHAVAVDHKALREGSQLHLVIRPGNDQIELRPEVDLFTSERTLSLTHRSAMVQATCVFYLAEKRRGTQVDVHLVYSGPGSWLATLFGRRHLAQITLESGLRGLKRLAERME
ncbi:MAG: SRPBCC family protein [Holophagales bacterium]|nr:SRPBCC family protein [Holophagales bacterium]